LNEDLVAGTDVMAIESSATVRRKIFISYCHVEPDQTVAWAAAERLALHHDVFIDRLIPPGSEWGEVIDTSMNEADFVIAFVSEKSVRSEMVTEEIRLAHQLRKTNGYPTLVPVRLAFTGALTYPLGAYLNPVQHLSWTSPNDTEVLLDVIERTLSGERPKPVVSVAKPTGTFGRLLTVWKPGAETLSTQERRNRRAMIERVRHDWIEGLNKQLLGGPSRLEIGLAGQRGTAETGIALQHPDEVPQPLPAGTRISDVFDDHLGQLLILGTPGSGKSTLLLELASELLELAERNEALPVPVVFQLSSWKPQPGGFGGWLSRELNRRYEVPQAIAVRWVEDERILPLLDGLDEVVKSERESCLVAINDYRGRSHGFAPIAVTSRIAEYEALTQRLRLPGAVILQPLTPDEIRRAFKAQGIPLEQPPEDSSFWELLNTPLMLSLATLSGTGSQIAKVDLETGRQTLLERYIDIVLRRRRSPVPREVLLRHLGWLASQMRSRNMTLFQLEDLDFDWLGSVWQRRLATILVLAAGSALAIGFGLPILLIFPSGLTRFGMTNWISSLVILGISEFFVDLQNTRPVDGVHFPFFLWCKTVLWHNCKIGFSLGVAVVLLATILLLIIGLVTEPSWRVAFDATINHIQTQTWYSPLIKGFGYGMFFSFFLAVREAPHMLVGKVITTRGRPMEGVWHSFHSALLSVSLMAILSASMLVIALLTGIIDFIFLAGGCSMLVSTFSIGGGKFMFRHWAIRAVLWLQRLPFRMVQFLDGASELALLRRIGGGYAFFHRYLLEHLDERYGPRSTDLGNN
jgi:hypothetical protein